MGLGAAPVRVSPANSDASYTRARRFEPPSPRASSAVARLCRWLVVDRCAALAPPPLPLLSPASSLRTAWLIALVCAMVVTAGELPYRLGFEPSVGPHAAAAVAAYAPLEVVCDIIFTLDLLLHARLAFWMHNGVVIDPVLLLQRYASTPMLLPLNLVAFTALPISVACRYEQPWARLPVLVRLMQLPSVSDDLLEQLWRGTYRRDNFSARKLVTLLSLTVFITHITACFYGVAFEVAYHPSALDVSNSTNGSAALDVGFVSHESPLPPFKRTYTYAIWWTTSALSALGGIPTPQPLGQLAFATATLTGALFTTVYLVAQLGVLIANLDASALTYRKKQNATELFVRRQGLPAELAARVSRYQQLAWVRGAGHNLRTVVNQMNPTIRSDIMHHICHAVVIAVPLFMSCEPKLIFLLMEVRGLDWPASSPLRPASAGLAPDAPTAPLHSSTNPLRRARISVTRCRTGDDP